MSLKIIEKSTYYLFMLLPILLIFGTLLSELSIILICILFLFYTYKTNNFSWIKNEDAKILFLLYFLLIINFIFSSNKDSSLLRDIGFIKYIIFIFAVKNLIINKIDVIKKIMNIWSIFLIIIIVDLYLEYFFGKNILGFYSTNPARLVGFLGNEFKIGTWIAGFLFPIISFWFYRLFYEKKDNKQIYLKKLFYLLSIILVVYILLPVGQRSIIIKTILLLIFFFYCFPFMIAKKKVLLSLLFILLSFSTIWYNENFKSRLIHQIFFADQETINLKETYKKSHYWKHNYSAYLVFKNNPIFGVGNKNYRSACLNFHDETNALVPNTNTHSVCATHPHQIYYEFLSEHGILGLFFIIILTALYLKKFSQFKKNNNLYLLGSFAYFIFTFMPLVPSGSFFTSFNATLFWINFCFMYYKTNNNDLNAS
ncbi:MAG: O-antigen ligase family protein [Pelagibacterales bacterium]|nr:O-antigen ligase family protein [Pelagibacterales bacterium]